MDYRKDDWPKEMECFQKAVNGGIDGYRIKIAEHYLVDRLDNDAYSDRIFTQNDIAVAIFNGIIIEGYSSEQNRVRQSRVSSLVTPSRVILGKDLRGNWVIVVIGLIASKDFQVVTCFPPDKPRYQKFIQMLEDKEL